MTGPLRTRPPMHTDEGETEMSETVTDDARVETVARALAASDGNDLAVTVLRYRYRRLAGAAIAAMPPSPAEEAVKRVEAVAAAWEQQLAEPRELFDWQVSSRATQRRMEGVVRDLRAALAGQHTTDQTPSAADSGALISDRSKRAARTVSPVVDHHSERTGSPTTSEEADRG